MRWLSLESGAENRTQRNVILSRAMRNSATHRGVEASLPNKAASALDERRAVPNSQYYFRNFQNSAYELSQTALVPSHFRPCLGGNARPTTPCIRSPRFANAISFRHRLQSFSCRRSHPYRDPYIKHLTGSLSGALHAF